MSDPIPSILTRLANTQRTLPNGGGNYAVANSTPATGDMNSQLTPSSYIKPSTVLSGPTTMSAAPTPWYMPSNDRGPASYGASQLANLPTQPATPEQIAAFNAGGPQTNNSQPNGQGGVVNQGWGGSPTVNEGGMGSGTPSGSTPSSVTPPEGFDPLRAYRDLAMEQAMHSSQGTGLYGLKKGVQYSPDQILEQRKSADNIYNQALQEYATYANNEGRNGSNTSVNENGKDYSSDPWMQGLVINGLVQGGTAAERKAHEAMLSKLPSDQKQQLIKSSLYNSMSAVERQTFDTGDNLGAGVKQIISDQPADFTTNPYKYVGQKYSVYLGGKQDPKYLNFKSMVGNLTAPIINQIYGAAVTNSELTRAQEFIPDLATDSTSMAMTKLQHLAGFYDYANANKLARKAGVPMSESMDDYIAKYGGSKDVSSNATGNVTMKRDDGKTTSFVFENGKWINK